MGACTYPATRTNPLLRSNISGPSRLASGPPSSPTPASGSLEFPGEDTEILAACRVSEAGPHSGVVSSTVEPHSRPAMQSWFDRSRGIVRQFERAGVWPGVVRAFLPIALSIPLSCQSAISTWMRWEQSLTSTRHYANPYSIELKLTCTGPNHKTIHGLGFWDGGNVFKIRCLFPEPGRWTWSDADQVAAPVELLRRDVLQPLPGPLASGDRRELGVQPTRIPESLCGLLPGCSVMPGGRHRPGAPVS